MVSLKSRPGVIVKLPPVKVTLVVVSMGAVKGIKLPLIEMSVYMPLKSPLTPTGSLRQALSSNRTPSTARKAFGFVRMGTLAGNGLVELRHPKGAHETFLCLRGAY